MALGVATFLLGHDARSAVAVQEQPTRHRLQPQSDPLPTPNIVTERRIHERRFHSPVARRYCTTPPRPTLRATTLVARTRHLSHPNYAQPTLKAILQRNIKVLASRSAEAWIKKDSWTSMARPKKGLVRSDTGFMSDF